MRRIRNKSAETQYGVDTGIGDIGEINVLAGEIFPSTDDMGEYLVGSLRDVFETVYNLSAGGGEINSGTNVGTGEAVYRDKTGTVLNFRTIKSGTGIAVTTVGDEVIVSATGTTTPPEELNITVDGQIDFTLAIPVGLPGSETRVYVNGQKIKYGTDYTFTSTTNLRYTSVSYNLSTADTLEIYYN